MRISDWSSDVCSSDLKAGVRMLIGDDYSGVFREVLKDDPLDHQVGCYGREFAYYAAIEGLSARDVLRWGTQYAGELLTDGTAKVGVVEVGALADLIVIDGDPAESTEERRVGKEGVSTCRSRGSP